MASYIIHILLTFLSLRLRLVLGQDYTYLGCFYDSNNRESLPDLIYCDRSRHPYETCQNLCGPQSQYCQSAQMTVELCRDICADQNMKYFGLQAGRQCLCGGFFAPYNVLGQPTGLNDTCNSLCAGNSSQMCGSDFQASVYQIKEPASDCFNPGYVLNGEQSQQDSSFYNENDTIDYTAVCPPPSIKSGAAPITCTASGNWTDPPPTCTVRCSTPTAPMHANFSAGQTFNDSYAVGDEVLFDCDNEPTMTNQLLTCGYYGDWEYTVMDCPEPTTTQPTTTPRPTTTLSSTTSSITPTTRVDDGGSTTNPTVVTVANSTVSPATQPTSTTTPTNDSVTTESSIGATSGGPLTTVTPTVTMSTMPSTVFTPTPSQSTDNMASMSSSPSGVPSSSPSSSTSSDASTSGPTVTMASSPGGQGTSTPAVTDGGEGTTVDSGRNQNNDMGLLPIILGAAAGVLVLILAIIIISVCCSRKRKQKTKNIPFNPALGASFRNPAFEEDEAEQSRRGFVQENEYGDSQTYDIGVSDYAMTVDEKNRDPPDGKDSPGANADGTEDVMYAVVNKNRQGSVTSFKPDDHRVHSTTIPQHENNDINNMYEGNSKSPLVNDSGYGDAYYTDPNNQLATPL